MNDLPLKHHNAKTCGERWGSTWSYSEPGRDAVMFSWRYPNSPI
jgi:hypothetical protein